MAELADIIAGYRGGDAVWWWQWRKLAALGGVGEARALLEAMGHQGDPMGWRRPLGCLLQIVPRAGVAEVLSDDAVLDALVLLLERLRWDSADSAIASPRRVVDGLAWLLTVSGERVVPRLWALLLGPPLPLLDCWSPSRPNAALVHAGAKTLALAHLRNRLTPDDAGPLLDLAVRPGEPGLVRSLAAAQRSRLLGNAGPDNRARTAMTTQDWNDTFWAESTESTRIRQACLKGWLLEHAGQPAALDWPLNPQAGEAWLGDLAALLPDDRAREWLLWQVHGLLPHLGDADAGQRAIARRCLVAAGAEAVGPLLEYQTGTTDWTAAESARQALAAISPGAVATIAALADTPEARERRCDALLTVAAGGTALLPGDLDILHRHGTSHHAVRLLQIAAGSRHGSWAVLVGAARIICRRVDSGELLQHPAGLTAVLAALRGMPADAGHARVPVAVEVAGIFLEDMLLAAGYSVHPGLRSLLDGAALPAASGEPDDPPTRLGAKPIALGLLAPLLAAADASWLRRLARRPDEPRATRERAARLALPTAGESARVDVLRALLESAPEPTVTAVTGAVLLEAAQPDPPGHVEDWLTDLLSLGLADAAFAPWLGALAERLVPLLGHDNVRARLLARKLLGLLRHIAVEPLATAVLTTDQWQVRQNAAELLGSLDPLALSRANAQRDGAGRGLSRAAGPTADAQRGLSAAGQGDG